MRSKVLILILPRSSSLHCDSSHYERGNLGKFVPSFAHCLHVNWSASAVIDQSRDLLREAQLGPSLQRTEYFVRTDDNTGSECGALVHLAKDNSTKTDRNAYPETISRLQHMYDSQRRAWGNGTGLPMFFSWPVLIAYDYVDLLCQEKPVALIILAYYAVLLHRAPDLWVVGNGGQFLIQAIDESLDARWNPLMEAPCSSWRATPQV